MSQVSTITWLVQSIGVVVVLLLAYTSFRRRSLKLGEEPTMPEYFTRRSMYWLGIGSYCFVIAAVFLILINVWLPIGPLIDVTVTHLRAGDLAGLAQSVDGPLILPWLIAAGFLFFVGFESRFNPLLIVRDGVLDVYAIPRKALDVYNALRSASMADIDVQTRREVIGYLIAPTLEEGDFDKARESIEFKWAHASLLYAKIQSYANDPSFQRFFTEPSLRWGDICLMVNENSEKLAVWRSQPQHYSKTLQLIGRLDELDRLLCRLLACLVIFGSANEKSMWETVVRLGGNPNRLRLKHTYKYLLSFAAAMVVGVVVGRELSVLLINGFSGVGTLRHFSFDTVRWIFYGLFIYVFPLALVFGSRILADRTVTTDPERRYYGFYALMMLLGFAVSTTMSALILGLAGTVDTGSGFNFIESLSFANRWGMLPALLCGYVAYEMDTPVSDLEPKRRMVWLAMVRFVAWVFVALIVMLYATDGLQPQAELRFAIVVTTSFVAGAIGAVTRFKTVSARYLNGVV